MTPETNQTRAVLRDLVAAFTEHPEAIVVEAQTAPGSCYWMLKGHPEDEAKLVGKEGSHVRALAFLVSRFGAAREEVHTFRLITERSPAPRRPAESRAVMSYDPRAVEELLVRILAELDVAEFAVRVGPGDGPRSTLTFLFDVIVRNALDYRILTVRPDPNTDETIVGAIGTLFRAIAKKNGVRFDLRVSES